MLTADPCSAGRRSRPDRAWLEIADQQSPGRLDRQAGGESEHLIGAAARSRITSSQQALPRAEFNVLGRAEASDNQDGTQGFVCRTCIVLQVLLAAR